MTGKRIRLRGIKSNLILKNSVMILVAIILSITTASIFGRNALISNSSELLTNFAKQVGDK